MTAADVNLTKANTARKQAVFTDLTVGLTLARLASQAKPRSDTRARNLTNARKAYDAVVRFSKSLFFTPTEEQKLNDGLAKLKSMLQDLGESFSL